MRIAFWSSAGVVLLATGMASAQGIRAAAPGTTGAVKPSSNGMVKPGTMVDPGMPVIRPKVPPASTPVIKPRLTTPDGSVVVPK